MTPTEVAAKLRAFNDWRRGDEDIPQFDPHEVSEAIDAAVEMIERLEAAEKSDAESLAMYRRARDERDTLRAEIERLRARIEEMEKQESVATVIKEGDSRHWMSERLWTFPDGKYPLYALPGAQAQPAPSLASGDASPISEGKTQPAPSVPTALLVAIADLVTQMEIVSRVGFVDTPNDKDSCAAFCVAEGTWLELMSAIESLASALAAAPEAKP